MKATKEKPPPQALSERFPLRYEIKRKLGEGGVATIYEIQDRKENAVRALKVLKPDQLQSETAVACFEDEFRILRHLRHPGLPEMYDYGITEDGTPYMVMEYIEGESLDTYHGEHPDELRILLYEITEALAFIHEHNLLHLDFKPENVLVRQTDAYGGGAKPQTVLIDFGMSYRRDVGGDIGVQGTPAYMAPEIIQGEKHLTRAVDYYGLGVTLYELIEGRPPFEGSLNDVLRAHLYNEVAFDGETVEYTDLYPHIRALMQKEPVKRLEGFEVFRRTLAARESSEAPPLERAYAMGYIESLGMFGKQEIWEILEAWTHGVSQALGERQEEEPGPGSEIIPLEGETISGQKGTTKISDLDLLKEVNKRAAEKAAAQPEKEKAEGPIKEYARAILITGDAGSGKSYLAEAQRGECLLRGMGVWKLGEGGDYEALVSEEMFGKPSPLRTASPAVSPHALLIDRFVRGWERLEEKGKAGGSVLFADGYEKLSKEEHDFIEYVGKRLDFAIDQGQEPGVFIMANGRSPRLKRDLKAILPKGEKLEQYIVPPPGKKDIEAILSVFHGHMAGTNDRRQLGEYLERNGESSGAMAEALRQAVVRGDLVREEGRWRFMWTTEKAHREEKEESNYYQLLLEELEEEDREVVSWLCCHQRPLSIGAFVEVSGIPEEALRISVERLKPYRLIDVSREKGEEHVGIVSESVAEGLYGGIPEPESKRIHERYLRYFGGELDGVEKRRSARHKRSRRKGTRAPSAARQQATAAEEALLNQYADLCKLMAFHYGRIGEIRASLLKRVKALEAMKRVKDVFGLRRLCEEGIRTVRRLQGKRWRSRKWHIERYFIKEWIEAEWMVENFRGVISVTEANILKRKRDLPLLSFFRYGMAMRWAGDYSACRKLLETERKKPGKKSQQRKAACLLFEAALMNNMNKYKRSVKLLDGFMKLKHYLSEHFVRVAYVYYTLAYYHLGEKRVFAEQVCLLKRYSKKNGYFDELLFAYYHEIDILFNSAKYAAAKYAIAKSIKLASKMKVYHRLCHMYQVLSGVYYEQGHYEQAIKYMNKSMQLASSIGLINWAIDNQLRISFNYEKMGSWGNSMVCAERVRDSARKHSWHDLHFYSLLQLFNLFIILRSQIAHVYKKRCKQLSPNIEAMSNIALYKYYLGEYYMFLCQFDRALRAFREAEKHYMQIGYEDDAIRSAIRIAFLFLEIGQYKSTLNILKRVKRNIKIMESNNLKGEFDALVMNYLYISRTGRKRIKNQAKLCGEQFHRISDIHVLLKMCVIMFRVYSRIGDRKKGLYYFKIYQQKMKMLVSQLRNPDYEKSIINGSEYNSLCREARLLIAK